MNAIYEDKRSTYLCYSSPSYRTLDTDIRDVAGTIRKQINTNDNNDVQ